MNSPSTSRIGHRCSAYVARCAASSGGISGNAYSELNRAYVDGLIVSRPVTFVRPDRKKVAAIPKRATSNNSEGDSARDRRSVTAARSAPTPP